MAKYKVVKDDNAEVNGLMVFGLFRIFFIFLFNFIFIYLYVIKITSNIEKKIEQFKIFVSNYDSIIKNRKKIIIANNLIMLIITIILSFLFFFKKTNNDLDIKTIVIIVSYLFVAHVIYLLYVLSYSNKIDKNIKNIKSILYNDNIKAIYDSYADIEIKIQEIKKIINKNVNIETQNLFIDELTNRLNLRLPYYS